MMYAYPIRIEYSRLEIPTYHKKLLPDRPLTLSVLKDIVGEKRFTIGTEYDDRGHTNVYIFWTTYRFETDQEMIDRVMAGERYMEEYHKRQKDRKASNDR